jgi:hypothetical protein
LVSFFLFYSSCFIFISCFFYFLFLVSCLFIFPL